MSDDISIPSPAHGAAKVSTLYTHSYRTRRSGMDAATRRLVLVASGLGLLLLLGMGVWTFSGHRSAGVPTIEADTRPLRVKPENPGGMIVAGANDQVLGGKGDGEAGDLAPEAERPDPQALRAQRQVASAPAPEPAAAAVPAEPPAPIASAAPAAVKPATPATGSMLVQVAAVETEAAAATEWHRLARKAPDLLGDRKPVIVKAERDGKTFWRVRTGGFADTAAAAEFCRKLRAKGLGCSIGS